MHLEECITLGSCFSRIIKARASGSKVYLYFMKKRAGRQDIAFCGILLFFFFFFFLKILYFLNHLIDMNYNRYNNTYWSEILFSINFTPGYVLQGQDHRHFILKLGIFLAHILLNFYIDVR